ncbi:hypothetical protein ACL02S_13800 [Nocardia sp. 004]|uniref:hypothetical protein n=1 Tax=Nocardia sp. 004 TaxID=3385978 RepID=UPI0039A2D47A
MSDIDFRVCPSALRLQAVEVRQSSEHWGDAKAEISAAPMKSGALGYFGKSIEEQFNTAAGEVVTKLILGQNSIKSAASALETCATHFENVDTEFYRQFGYIDAQLER